MSQTREDNPRFILGLKLRRLRLEAGRTLKEIAAAAGLSVSYLSEIEKGKKYPKPEKMLALAEALGVAFDELVSLQVTADLSPLKQALASPLLREFPFDLFGLEAGDVLELVNTEPARTSALIHALLEVGQSCDVDIETFLQAALRAYQQMNSNYFPQLESAAEAFREAQGWERGRPVSPEELAATLKRDFSYSIDTERLGRHPDLRGFRSVFRRGRAPRLFVNGDLMPSQQAFVLAREVGYQVLGLEERAMTSSWLRVESFDQLINNFMASYFSGALLLDRVSVRRDLERLFAADSWQPDLLRAAMDRFEATPETFFTRVTQVAPHDFGLEEMVFLRLSTQADGSVQLTKLLNTSELPLTLGLNLREHHCRRWMALRLLSAGGSARKPQLAAQRSRFLTLDQEFFTISSSRALALDHSRRSAVALGWRLDRRFRRVAGFWRDPAVADDVVDLTCERCPLSSSECVERAAEPFVLRERRGREAKEAALATLDET